MTNTLESSEKNFFKIDKALPLIALFVALIAMAFAGILIELSEGELSPYSTIFHRFWTAFIFLGLWLTLKVARQKFNCKLVVDLQDYKTRDLILLVAAGSTFWAWNALWAWSLTGTTVTNSTLLHNLTSVFASIGGWLIWGRRLDSRFGLAMLVAFAGVICLEIQDLQISTDNFIGDLAALLSSVFYAGNLMLIETLRSRFSTTTIILWSCAIATVLSLPILWLRGEQVFPSTWQGWCFVICLGIVCQVLGQGLVAYSLKKLSSAFVSLSELLEPVLTGIGAWIIFSERLSLSSWVAFVVVLLGLSLAISSKSVAKE